jgi:N-acetylmuramoyl-L-alanine amidase
MALLAAAALLLDGCTGGPGSGTSSGAGGTTSAGPAGASPTAGAGGNTASGGGTVPGGGAGSGGGAGGPVAGSPVVVLDPGHNGGNAAHPALIERLVTDGRDARKPCNTTGTATEAGYPEHAFNFDVAQRTERVLEAAGVRVVLTRPNDVGVGPCVDVRGTAGQRADAAAVVAIHADGAAPSGSGFHVALASPPLNPAQAGQARALGTALHDALRGAGFHDATYLGERGISLRPDLAGLNFATRPAALVECANMRNPAEAAFVSSADGRQRYATALATGILAYLRHA